MALVIALLATFLVAVSVLLIASYLQIHTNAFHLEHRNLQLTALTDAVMAETLANLAADRHFTGVERRPYATGTITSTVKALSPNRVHITATAWYGSWTASLEAEVSTSGPAPKVIRWHRHQGPGTAPGAGDHQSRL
jgi:hypothetical protein